MDKPTEDPDLLYFRGRLLSALRFPGAKNDPPPYIVPGGPPPYGGIFPCRGLDKAENSDKKEPFA